ncbi:endonuclease/exonuclease/phosphatase family protein [Aquimarina sp. U1-2]|uniref:endonuclease/exonuclease/phosphatase family protein n=1 Tax=Aquimarina sp. U1-2 TaxID=2823141 RepID=UPI001AEC7AF9|nr:endonuclease/exonuclease/phosphatase family protein [Aquimarina sp. U1-2]MBP2832355.1 endonuclease/exonuclease/phosphatase family protein [Aquimarina sp. U1-2]
MNKIVFLINSLVAFALLLSYILPHVAPKTFPLSVLSLTVPVLILLNLVFFMYWVILLNKRGVLSLIILLLGVSHLSSLYRLSGSSSTPTKDSITLLSYNVRSFDRFDWIKSGTIPQDISKLVLEQEADIFCAQEYFNTNKTDFSQYPYQYEDFNNNWELGLVIFSKFPIINKGSLGFKKTANNIIFADILIKKDTIRIYNLHLQSHGISSNTDRFDEADSQKLLKRVQVSFETQQEQVEMLIAHMKKSSFKKIVMGDFNNTAYSYIYNQLISEGLIDTFKEAGSGFGKTFEFDLFPLRIDFILVPEDTEVLAFKNFEVHYSDHYPIFTRIEL